MRKTKYWEHYDSSKCGAAVTSDSPFLGHLEGFCESVRVAISSNSVITDKIKNMVISAHVENLANRLDVLTRQTMLLEKHIYEKAFNTSWNNLESFGVFVQSEKIYLAHLFDSYPALTQSMDILTENFSDACIRFLKRLFSDFNELGNIWDGDVDLKNITKVELTSGELHSGSQSVIVIHVDGSPYCLYKPRNLDVENRLTNLLEKISDMDPFAKNWELPRYSGRDVYGWVSWVQQAEVADPYGVSKFFHRIGFLIGFAELLGVTDLHFANIIAAGSSPVPVDLEAALSMIVLGDEEDGLDEFARWNLLGTGMLPSSTWKGGDQVGIDICGVGCLAEQYCSMPVMQNVDKSGRSELFSQGGVDIPTGENRCILNGVAKMPWDYISEISEGYSSVMSKSSYLSELTNDFQEITNLPTRYILRSTAGYHMALVASANPSIMRNVEKRTKYIESCLPDVDAQIRAVELEAIASGDVPRFEIRSADLRIFEPKYLPNGAPLGFDAVDGITAAKKLVANIVPDRIRAGLDIIHGSLSALRLHYEHHETSVMQDILSKNEKKIGLEKSILLADMSGVTQYAKKQYEKVCLGVPTAWYGTRTNAAGSYEYGHIGYDFYNGITGIIYALVVAQKPLPREIVEREFQEVVQKMRSNSSHLGGAHFGLASTILPWRRILESYAGLDYGDLLRAAKIRLQEVLEGKFPEQYFTGMDLLCGMAGCLNVYSLAAAEFDDSEMLRLCDSLFELMDSTARRNGDYFPISRAVSVHDSGCLTGLSHGQIGIAACLASYANVTRNKRSRSRAQHYVNHLLEWEIGQFQSDVFNWPDLRVRTQNSGNVVNTEFGWSHGAPGIYAALFELSINYKIAADFIKKYPFEQAVRAWLDTGKVGKNDTICHGNLGVFLLSRELLRKELSDDDCLLTRLHDACKIETIFKRSETINALQGFEVQGLYTGNAGKMLGLMKVCDPSIVFPFLNSQI